MAASEPSAFNVGIHCKDEICAPVAKAIRSFEGKILLHSPVNLVLRCGDTMEASDSSVPVFIGADLSVEEIKNFAAEHPVKIGYLINCVGSKDPKHTRTISQKAATTIAHSVHLHLREVCLTDFEATQLLLDLSNLAMLLACPEAPAQKAFLLKRYLDSVSHLDEVCLAFAEHGVLRRTNEAVAQVYEPFPVSLTRTRCPRPLYAQARRLNEPQNELWMKATFDVPYLLDKFAPLEQDDDMVRNLMSIVRKGEGSQWHQGIKLAISRNDFMIQEGHYLQVEFNLIAASLGVISHRHSETMDQLARKFGDSVTPPTDLEFGDNEQFLYRAFREAHKAYGKPKAIVVMVCQQEGNVFDQWAPAHLLAEEGISFQRYSFEDLHSLLHVDALTGCASVAGEEVALFYFRQGFVPKHYDYPHAWKVREQIELSSAIKCPDAAMQLVNMKYFQYVLNKEEAWTHFGFSSAVFDECRRTFCDIFTVWDFKDKQGMLAHLDKTGIDNWVLKPQREGGDNNFFGEAIREQINSCSDKLLAEFILMRKIESQVYTGIHCDWNSVVVREVDDEYGLFHYSLWKDGQPLSSEPGGTLVWTKAHKVNEGGVHMRSTVINSPELSG